MTCHHFRGIQILLGLLIKGMFLEHVATLSREKLLFCLIIGFDILIKGMFLEHVGHLVSKVFFFKHLPKKKKETIDDDVIFVPKLYSNHHIFSTAQI